MKTKDKWSFFCYLSSIVITAINMLFVVANPLDTRIPFLFGFAVVLMVAGNRIDKYNAKSD